MTRTTIRGCRTLHTVGLAGLALAGFVGLGGCQSDAGTGAAIGGGIGAIAGAIIGHQSGHGGEGAAIGAGAGLLTGYIIGNESDKERHERSHGYYRRYNPNCDY